LTSARQNAPVRKAAVDYARGSVRLEGFVVSPFAEDLNRRYIDGEITRKEMTAALLAHYNL
jgi:Antitoxin VbhA